MAEASVARDSGSGKVDAAMTFWVECEHFLIFGESIASRRNVINTLLSNDLCMEL